MSVYTVVIMSFTGVPVSLVVDEPNAYYALLSSFILFSTTLTLCLVFIPKVKFIKREIKLMQTIIAHGK